MKRTIIAASFILAILTSVVYLNSSDANASETKKESTGFINVYSDCKNTGGSYCGTSSGSFTTNSSGFVRLNVPNGTYTICVSGCGTATGIVVNNNFVDAYVSGSGVCPCGN